MQPRNRRQATCTRELHCYRLWLDLKKKNKNNKNKQKKRSGPRVAHLLSLAGVSKTWAHECVTELGNPSVAMYGDVLQTV